MNDRIKKLRKTLKMSQDEFAKKLGYTRGKITNIELNKTEPEEPFIDLICQVFNVNKEWITLGEGEMFAEMSREEYIAKFVGSVLRDKEETFKKRYISMLSKLDEDGWKALEQVAKAMGQIK